MEESELVPPAMNDDGVSLEGLYALARFHWLRCQALPAENALADLVHAFSFLSTLFDAAAELLPVINGDNVRTPAPRSATGFRYLSGVEAGQARRDLAAYERAVDLLDLVVAALPAGQVDPYRPLADRAALALFRIDDDSSLTEIDSVISSTAAALRASSGGSDEGAEWLTILSELWYRRFLITGAGSNLDVAVTNGQDGVEATTQDDYRVVRLQQLRTALIARFELTGTPADQQALAVVDRQLAPAAGAWAAGGEPDQDDAVQLVATAGNLRHRFARTGSVEDLDQAVAALRRAVEVTRDHHPDQGLRRSMLAETMAARSEQAARLEWSSRPEPLAASGPARSLTLRTTQFRDDDTWTWELRSTDRLLASKQVQLPRNNLREPFFDLSGFVSRYNVPQLATSFVRGMVESLGAWVTEDLLGPIAAAIAAELPATVTVTLDPRPVAHRRCPAGCRPGGLHVAGRTRRNILLRRRRRHSTAARRRAGSDACRFPPAPRTCWCWGLRAERLAIEAIVAQAVRAGQPVTLTCLQYGVTRASLRATLADGPWHVVHVGGHGAHSGLVLEGANGEQDLATNEELMAMLRPLAGSSKLVVLGTCSSGANRAADVLESINGASRAAERSRVVADQEPGDLVAGDRAGGLAATVAAGLSTTVVAMRFAVQDDFARDYVTAFYEALLLRGMPIDRASGHALDRSKRLGVLKVGDLLAPLTPVIYSAVGPDQILVEKSPSADVPVAVPSPDPALFVGRSEVLAGMSHLLEAGQGHTAVCLTGMPGAGKSACLDRVPRHRRPALRSRRPGVSETRSPRRPRMPGVSWQISSPAARKSLGGTPRAESWLTVGFSSSSIRWTPFSPPTGSFPLRGRRSSPSCSITAGGRGRSWVPAVQCQLSLTRRPVPGSGWTR